MPDVRQVGEHDVVRPGVGSFRRQQIGFDERDPVGDRVTDGILAGKLEGIRRDVGREDRDSVGRATLPQLDREGDRDRAASRADIHDPQRAPARRRRSEPADHSLHRQLDEALRLRPRDQRAAVHLKASP